MVVPQGEHQIWRVKQEIVHLRETFLDFQEGY
jgi:hypothetical protein